jgi:EmrB/QacA subfamily drug resistance transporter
MRRDRRWYALYVVCCGVLMVVLDSTIVNVALPTIGRELEFTTASLVWVVEAYMVTFSGSLLFSGRLGDVYQHRRVFLFGVGLFTLASLGCGFASTQTMMIATRAVQGFSGAVVLAASLSLIMSLFTDPLERPKALGVYSFISGGGGALGLVLGGVLTNALSWRWVFLVNVPVGVLVWASCASLLPKVQRPVLGGRIDFPGAALLSSSLMLGVYGIVSSGDAGWSSPNTQISLLLAAILMSVFIWVESRTSTPLVPVNLLRRKQLLVSNIIAGLWSTGGAGWFFVSALYMQLVLGCTPLQIGLAFLPATLTTAILSLGFSAKLVARAGTRTPLVVGLALVSAGLAWLARASVEGTIVFDVLPGMALVGLGAGIASNPLLLVAMGSVSSAESGLASGIVNTSFMMGGVIGLAILASVASAVSSDLLAGGTALATALTASYRVVFALSAGCLGAAALLGLICLRDERSGAATPCAVRQAET